MKNLKSIYVDKSETGTITHKSDIVNDPLSRTENEDTISLYAKKKNMHPCSPISYQNHSQEAAVVNDFELKSTLELLDDWANSDYSNFEALFYCSRQLFGDYFDRHLLHQNEEFFNRMVTDHLSKGLENPNFNSDDVQKEKVLGSTLPKRKDHPDVFIHDQLLHRLNLV